MAVSRSLGDLFRQLVDVNIHSLSYHFFQLCPKSLNLNDFRIYFEDFPNPNENSKYLGGNMTNKLKQ